MKIRYLIIIILLLSCGKSNKNSIIVAVAANTQFAMDEIVNEFNDTYNTKIQLISSSSGKITAQIKNGAPYDIFLSADMTYPQTLYKDGFSYNKPVIYAKGVLVIWYADSLNFNKNISELVKSNNINKIAIGNPKNAPYGAAAWNILKINKLLSNTVISKMVYAENISQVNQYIVNKAVDVAFTSKSSVLSKKMINIGKWKEIDNSNYKEIEQGIIMLKHGMENNEIICKKFYDFMFQEKAKNILKKYGYEIIE